MSAYSSFVENNKLLFYIPGQKFAILEEKVILSNILRKFKVEAVEKMEDLTIISEIILKSKSGIKVRLAPRKRTVE